MSNDAQPLYGFVGPDVTEHIGRMYPPMKIHFSPHGNLFFRLKRYIYGTNEASKRFFDTMTDFLVGLNFQQSLCDPCLFIFSDGNDLAYVGVYVDDLLIAANSVDLMARFSAEFRDEWNTVFHQGNDFNYVGLHIVRSRSDRSMRVDMSGNIQKLITQFGNDVKESNVPCIDSILVQSGEPLNEAGQKTYLSLVMSVLYPARMVHLSILFATTILATRMQKPTSDDLAHAYRIIGYLKTQIDGGLTLRGTPASQLKVYVDASHAIHPDGKGHGCMIAALEESPIAWRSHKLPHVTLSSTESEISVYSESSTYIVWLRHLLQDLGHHLDGPTPIMEDNTSAIHIMEQGGNFQRTKHILVRYSFIQEQARFGLIRFVHCPTQVQCADLLTKVQSATRIRDLLRLLLWSTAHHEGV